MRTKKSLEYPDRIFGSIAGACQYCYVTNKYTHLFYVFVFYLRPIDEFIGGFHSFLLLYQLRDLLPHEVYDRGEGETLWVHWQNMTYWIYNIAFLQFFVPVLLLWIYFLFNWNIDATGSLLLKQFDLVLYVLKYF